jgi:hypothetical protein
LQTFGTRQHHVEVDQVGAARATSPRRAHDLRVVAEQLTDTGPPARSSGG